MYSSAQISAPSPYSAKRKQRVLRAAALKKPLADKAGPSLKCGGASPKNKEVCLRWPAQLFAGAEALSMLDI